MHVSKNNSEKYYPVIIVGGGQAGLSISYYLQKSGMDHLVIEKTTVMNAWKHKRWDSFTLVTPNWQCDLPGHSYDGDDPHGFMSRDEIIAYLERFAEKVNAPVLENTSVNKIVSRGISGYRVETSSGIFLTDQVVVAAGGYHEAIIPRMAERLPETIYQLHSEQYRNPQQLPEGAVLVVGSGQSGAQIAEDLHIAGKKVYLATGDAPRCARFYRGRDVVDWLADMKYYDMPVHEHPLREAVRDNTNHYVTGRDGGRDIDLRKFALEGMELFGSMSGFDGDRLLFKDNLTENLDRADEVYNNINMRIDDYIAANNIDAPGAYSYEPVWRPGQARSRLSLADSNITAVLWCIGFRPDFSWLDVPVFNGMGYPQHQRGVTSQPGLYFIGLPWLYTWGSGRFSGIARDADYLCRRISDFSVSEGAELKSA
ncbi:MSMEG_0569 family flavin-dependent oxidoreductase [Exilibacterium tricleocarpae]|uniref:MSMEG_0569 family flavin-dependent oxidoreductase n=1 Tax=Exilibacterium tricleocarpae TaxID=2591008 RepID=A0A545U9Y2_9GAMM|nr:MSMEG_0569 family flavin-dependent oxidoreductase [Exilibacterium tricleocarpae]TQV86287.1 MSMEG_0569 family flavin-dependent oxidoreductase [Exilibacterium tricleocarpae]